MRTTIMAVLAAVLVWMSCDVVRASGSGVATSEEAVSADELQKLYPLGLKMGMTKAEAEKVLGFELEKEAGSVDSYKKTLKVGKLPFGMEQIYLKIDDVGGLHAIVLLSPVVETGHHGTELRSLQQDLVEGITNKYGKSSTYIDSLKSGSVWKNPEDFVMSIIKKERIFSIHWLPDNKETREMASTVKREYSEEVTLHPTLNKIDVAWIELVRSVWAADVNFHSMMGVKLRFTNSYGITEKRNKESGVKF